MPAVVLFTALLAFTGCGEAPLDSSDEVVTTTTGAVSSVNPTYILLAGNRTASNGVLTLRRLSPSGPTDSESIRVTLYPPGAGNPHNQSLLAWTNQSSNYLRMTGFGQGIYPEYPTYSSIKIADFSGVGASVMRVTLQVYINGECHEDSEDIDWNTPPLLRFDVTGATWDGTCFRGNFLRRF